MKYSNPADGFKKLESLAETQLEPQEIRNCVDCGCKFEISVGAARYFKNNKLELPKRCYICRKRRQSEHELTAARTLRVDMLNREINAECQRIAEIEAQLKASKSRRHTTDRDYRTNGQDKEAK